MSSVVQHQGLRSHCVNFYRICHQQTSSFLFLNVDLDSPFHSSQNILQELEGMNVCFVSENVTDHNIPRCPRKSLDGACEDQQESAKISTTPLVNHRCLNDVNLSCFPAERTYLLQCFVTGEIIAMQMSLQYHGSC